MQRRRGVIIGLALFVGALIAFRYVHRGLHCWSIDDAAVTYAASYELADHGSLAAYPEGPPVEGYSNPLVFFTSTGLRCIGWFDPAVTHIWLEALLFGVMVVLVWSLLRRFVSEIGACLGAVLFAIVELATPSTWLWYSSGLENVWVSAGVVALVWLCARTSAGVPLRMGWGVLAGLVALTRPEAPVYVAACYGALLAFSRSDATPWRVHILRIARAAAVTSAMYLCFLLWRRVAYGEWLPNTYFAKLSNSVDVGEHLRTYVLAKVFPYAVSALFASAVFAMLVTASVDKLGRILFAFLIASLALPLTAGEDWMGEHRFATTFFAVSHLAFAAFAALCIDRVAQRDRLKNRINDACAVVAVLVLPALLVYERFAGRAPQPSDDVSIARVARLQGGLRWEHQMRLGLPYAVTLLPDAGGSLLVGGMQLLDSGYLTDYTLPRLGRFRTGPTERSIVDQYEHAERRPDLVDGNPHFAFDLDVFDKWYVVGDAPHGARRDLVEVPQIDPDSVELWRGGGVRVLLSADTVRFAAPSSLARAELLVAWDDVKPDPAMHVRMWIAGGDRDELSLKPYQPAPSGIERRALLIGAPYWPGDYTVWLEVLQGDRSLFRGPAYSLEVGSDADAIMRVATRLAGTTDPARRAKRIAWLREQLVPRLGMTAFHATVGALVRDRGATVGANIHALRRSARLSDLDVPDDLRRIEDDAIAARLAVCPAAELASRVVCLGRAVDELRRLGYLQVLSRMPDLARELSDARAAAVDLPTPTRYQVLVGLMLADPSDLDVQRKLIPVRAELARGDFPPVM